MTDDFMPKENNKEVSTSIIKSKPNEAQFDDNNASNLECIFLFRNTSQMNVNIILICRFSF